MSKSIQIHYKDGMVTRFEYNTETFHRIAQGMSIIRYVEIENRPLFNTNPNQRETKMSKYSTTLSKREIEDAIRLTNLYKKTVEQIKLEKKIAE